MLRHLAPKVERIESSQLFRRKDKSSREPNLNCSALRPLRLHLLEPRGCRRVEGIQPVGRVAAILRDRLHVANYKDSLRITLKQSLRNPNGSGVTPLIQSSICSSFDKADPSRWEATSVGVLFPKRSDFGRTIDRTGGAGDRAKAPSRCRNSRPRGFGCDFAIERAAPRSS